ncbi:MAG TPA: hypothetical protein VFZ18_10155 [Longimicrobiaceae bacterium]
MISPHGPMLSRVFRLVALPLSASLACAPVSEAARECQIVQPSTALAGGLAESSGVAASREHTGILWTHNDSGNEAELSAVRASGERVAAVRLRGVRMTDWEDLSLAPCESGSCLYVADIGDGDGRRREIAILRVPEPDPSAATEAVAERFPARYPDGPRDAEAMFILPSGEIHLVTKGRTGGVEIFRYPLPLRAGETVTLEPVRTLAAGQQPLDQQVTGASASPSGDWVAIRTYKTLQLWRTADLLGGEGTPHLVVDLGPLGEPQGEAVALLDDGTVVVTSEGGFPGAVGSVAVLRCQLTIDS